MKKILLIALSALTMSSWAKVVSFGEKDASIIVRYEVTDAKIGPNPTYLRFPRAVSRIDNATLFTVKASAPVGQQSDYQEMELRPRFREGSQRLEVLLDDGTVVRVRAKIVEKPGLPSSYDFEPSRTLESAKPESEQKSAQIADLQVLREILKGDLPVGMQRASLGIPVSCRVVGLEGRLVRTFESERFKAFQYELTNNSIQREFKVHEDNFVLKGRDLSRSGLIHVSSKVISPRRKGVEKSTVTIVTDPAVRASGISICENATQIETVSLKGARK